MDECVVAARKGRWWWFTWFVLIRQAFNTILNLGWSDRHGIIPFIKGCKEIIQ